MRGYSFNINSGAVESLELDSFGISFIPSSLVGKEEVLHNKSITMKAYYSEVTSILIRIVCMPRQSTCIPNASASYNFR